MEQKQEAEKAKGKKTAKTHLETQGFKEYDRLRKYMGLIYLYGCFRAEDLARVNGRSVQHYNATIKLLWSLFWEDQQLADTMGRKNNKTCPYIPRSYAASAQNRMADSYMMFSVDRKSLLLLYLRLLQRLRDGSATAAQLEKAVEYLPAIDLEVYQNCRKHARLLSQYGYAALEGRTFRQREDGLEALTLSELWQLYHYVCFASNVTYPRVPGSFLRRTLERELLRRGQTVPSASALVLRHNSNHNVFDEEVVFRLLHLIEKRQGILIDGVKHLPVQLRIDCRLGRWYALMAREEAGALTPCIRAVSRMELPTACEGGDDPMWEQAKALVERAYRHSLFSGITGAAPVELQARLCFDRQGRQDQFTRELRVGEVTQTPEGACYHARISDPQEMLPLLRSYAPWLRVLPGDHALDQQLRQSLEEMLAALAGAPWDAGEENPRTFARQKSQAVPGKEPEQELRERVLLSPFQGRLLQFCLELLATLEGGQAPDLERLTRKYGMRSAWDTLKLLREAQILQPGEPLALSPRYGKAPLLPMSEVEREYLQYILDPVYMPEVALFLTDQTRERLKGEAPAWAKHIRQLKPLGAALPQQPGPEGFRVLLDAIRENRLISYRYRSSKEARLCTAQCLPWKLEYSAYDRRWWIILYDTEDRRTIKARLDNLQDITLGQKSDVTEAQILKAMEKLRMEQEVVLRVRDRHNALQRCFTAFENQQITESSYSPEEGYTLKFRPYSFDIQEILRQLMYLGPNVHLEAPESLRQALRVRLKKALE